MRARLLLQVDMLSDGGSSSGGRPRRAEMAAVGAPAGPPLLEGAEEAEAGAEAVGAAVLNLPPRTCRFANVHQELSSLMHFV